MSFLNEPTLQSIAQYAYEPATVYLSAVAMMIASGFGFPVPEEFTIVSLGLLSFIGSHPEHFPPPESAAGVVNVGWAALICFSAVVLSDFLVFTLGRTFGRRILVMGPVARVMTPKVMARVETWLEKYGLVAVGCFRFTPGFRFPAHVIIGMSKMPVWKFILVDAIAALLSVPTQILLIAHYGEVILTALYRFKLVIFYLIVIGLFVYLIRRFLARPKAL